MGGYISFPGGMMAALFGWPLALHEQNSVAGLANRVLAGVADLDVPTILFGVGTGELLDLMATAGSHVVVIDWHVDLDEGRRRTGKPSQGNLDPARCLGGVDLALEATREVLARAGAEAGHIFNLGHGVLPQTDPAVLEAVVRLVHDEGKAGVR